MTVLISGSKPNVEHEIFKLKAEVADLKGKLSGAVSYIKVKRAEEKRKVRQEATAQLIADKQKKKDDKIGIVVGCILFTSFFLFSGGLLFITRNPPIIPDPLTVHLAKVNGTFGLIIRGHIVEGVIPGGAADIQGEIKNGDQIVEINNSRIQLEWDHYVIMQMIEKGGDNLTLTLRTIVTSI